MNLLKYILEAGTKYSTESIHIGRGYLSSSKSRTINPPFNDQVMYGNFTVANGKPKWIDITNLYSLTKNRLISKIIGKITLIKAKISTNCTLISNIYRYPICIKGPQI